MNPSSELPIGETFASDLEICYEVLLYLSSRLARLQAGEALEYFSGDPSAEAKIRDWCDARAHTLLACEQQSNGRWRFVIQKG